jgi:hypothetical protein
LSGATASARTSSPAAAAKKHRSDVGKDPVVEAVIENEPEEYAEEEGEEEEAASDKETDEEAAEAEEDNNEKEDSGEVMISAADDIPVMVVKVSCVDCKMQPKDPIRSCALAHASQHMAESALSVILKGHVS